MVDPAIFEQLQAKIDEDIVVREQLRKILQDLEKQGRTSHSTLARAHSTPAGKLEAVTTEAEKSIDRQIQTVSKLAEVASQHPYYKYNNLWTRDVQNLCFAVIFCGWLGGYCPSDASQATPLPERLGRLLTIEDVGKILSVPVNLKPEQDEFHLTVEEYLQALISLIDELARLAVNSVTLGDYDMALRISQFIKDIHAGFQILNLKNDTLRKRSDSIKYSVKKVEDVVYDLSLRNLITKS